MKWPAHGRPLKKMNRCGCQISMPIPTGLLPMAAGAETECEKGIEDGQVQAVPAAIIRPEVVVPGPMNRMRMVMPGLVIIAMVVLGPEVPVVFIRYRFMMVRSGVLVIVLPIPVAAVAMFPSPVAIRPDCSGQQKHGNCRACNNLKLCNLHDVPPLIDVRSLKAQTFGREKSLPGRIKIVRSQGRA